MTGTAALAAAAPARALELSADPGLFPPFASGIHDYVTRCHAPAPVHFTVTTDAGETASVDGAPPRSGSFESDVALGSGEATTIRATRQGAGVDYHVRCLPPGFPDWRVELAGRPSAQWYLMAPQGAPWVALFNGHGTPVWWWYGRANRLPFNPTPLSGGGIAWYMLPPDIRFGHRANIDFDVHRLDGTLVRHLGTVGVPTDGHELRELANGHFLLDAYRPARHREDLRRFGGDRQARVYYPEVQEITRSGRLVWRWNARGHIRLSEAKRWWPDQIKVQSRHTDPRKRHYDPFHINSIAPDGDGVVVSLRQADAIYRIDRRTGRVDWKLGGTHTKRSLRIVGPLSHRSESFGGQHDVRLLPDGTLTLYDNGTGYQRAPRVLRFRIDAARRTATLLEELSDPQSPYSSAQGSARKLPNGNWVISWAISPSVTEMTPAGKVVMRLVFPRRWVYRAVPIPFGRYSAARLRSAMDRMHPR